MNKEKDETKEEADERIARYKAEIDEAEIALNKLTNLIGDIYEEDLNELNLWVVEHGIPQGELIHLTSDIELGTPSCPDLFWPNGLGSYSPQPTAVLLSRKGPTIDFAKKSGIIYFISIDDFKQFIQKEISNGQGEI